jgi:hypothetical protein
MPTIFELKEQGVLETPLLLFECRFANGQTERWSTHRASVNGDEYAPRVLRHNLFEIQTASDQGVDAIPRVALTLANADSRFSQIERATGWKGAKLTVRFLFFNLKLNSAASESTVLFQGIANPPDEISESEFRVTAINRMSMQRVLLPDVRVQRRCPWEFPTTAAQREEAVTGGEKAQYSRFFRCGYSADIASGAGNLNGEGPYLSCSYTRADCEARGMFRADQSNRETRRFGGVEFVPSSVAVRSYGEKGAHVSPLSANEARYNDFVPLLYGTAWHTPSIVFARNDGNLTHMEVLLGMGEIEGVLKVLVNDIEIPVGQSGRNMGGTGWYNLPGSGNRTGNFNLDFTTNGGEPAGDPYGSMAYLSLVVPNRVNDGRSLPHVKVLVQGMKLPRFLADGSFLDLAFTSNPAWILLDVLRRSGWTLGEIDIPSFVGAAAYCDETIQVNDLYGNTVSVPRFQCNLALKNRRSAADVIRGIRNASRLYLTYGTGGGLLQVRVENTLALQHPVKPDWSNATGILDGGWPSYEFGDGSSGTSGIARLDGGQASIRLWSRSSTDTPNRFSVEFQDSFNEFQQDSFSLVDVDDLNRTGQEITTSLPALGIPSYEQAARILKFNLDKVLRGNLYVEFETSVRAIGLSPGDIVTLTYLKEGFLRKPFRVLRIAPGINFRTARITAQIHDDEWYSDTNGNAGELTGGRRAGYGLGLPRPLMGNSTDTAGAVQFGLADAATEGADGRQTVDVSAGFLPPDGGGESDLSMPLVSLSATVVDTGGTLKGDEQFYYGVSAVDGGGRETALSFLVSAHTPGGTNTNSVTITGLSFAQGTSTFHVYRGSDPARLFRIASAQPPAQQFTDYGLAPLLIPAPDPNFDHANFYWRLELQPEFTAAIHSALTAGNPSMDAPVNDYRGALVRITSGRGAGQEREVDANTATTLTLKTPWDVAPDAGSRFVVAESGWRFGATATASPVRFEVPNRAGATIHVTGVAANANDVESPLALATVTRWYLSGALASGSDADAPPLPVFGLTAPPSGGGVELSGVAFSSLVNTRTITAATLTLYYWDELTGVPQLALSANAGVEDTALDLTAPSTASAGSFVQVDAEIFRVEEVQNGGLRLVVTRAVHGSSAQSHAALERVYSLSRKVVVAPFPRDFFGSPSSGSWSFPVRIPGVRIASAELTVTNQKGDSPAAELCLTQTLDYGLRTLSGGQFSIQVEGFLPIENSVAPELVIDAAHAVRDVFAVVSQAPSGGPIELLLRHNGDVYCALTIPQNATMSSAVSGLGLPPLAVGARLSLDITAVGPAAPGADLTVTVRL